MLPDILHSLHRLAHGNWRSRLVHKQIGDFAVMFLTTGVVLTAGALSLFQLLLRRGISALSGMAKRLATRLKLLPPWRGCDHIAALDRRRAISTRELGENRIDCALSNFMMAVITGGFRARCTSIHGAI